MEIGRTAIKGFARSVFETNFYHVVGRGIGNIQVAEPVIGIFAIATPGAAAPVAIATGRFTS
jgi:hypothetical protein